jgi:hypothetical protein
VTLEEQPGEATVDKTDQAKAARRRAEGAVHGGGGGGDGDGGGPDGGADTERYSVFHAIMLFAALYMGMLLTDWGSGAEANLSRPEGGKTAMWVKVLSQWATMLIYTWTLAAPSLFPDRDFGV